MDEKLIETLREFAEAIKQLRREVRELQPLKDTVADLRQRVAALEQRTLDRDLAGALDQLRREVDELKRRSSGSPQPRPQSPLNPTLPGSRQMVRGKFPQLTLRVSPDEAVRRLQEIPHSKCQGGVPTKWKVDGSRRVPYQSVNWLFCWGKTGMSSPEAAEESRRVFDDILDMPFAEYDAIVDHEAARNNRG